LSTSLTPRWAAVAAGSAIEASRPTLRRAEFAHHLLLFGSEDLFELRVDDFLKGFDLAALFIRQTEPFLNSGRKNLSGPRALSAESAATETTAAAEAAAISASAFTHGSASTWLTTEAIPRLAAVRPVALWSASSISIARRSITVTRRRAAGSLRPALGAAAHRSTAPAGLGECGALFGEELFQFSFRGGAVLVRIGAIKQGMESLIGQFGFRQRAVFVGVEGEEAFDESVDPGGGALFCPAASVAGRIGLSEDRSGDKRERRDE
jgi:hypothetical protein